jgi:dTDP-4-dehydrorhamnose reductase
VKVLLTGANGQLGRCIQNVFSAAADCELIALDRAALDIADAGAVAAAIQQYRPNVIINAAAYTAVDKAESEPELAAQINVQGPANLASAASAIGALLIHISTDYVFDGSKRSPYTEDDPTQPQGVYGRTKLAGEEAVRQGCAKHIILRTAWVFSEYGNNFVKTMLRLAHERDELSVVDDQTGCPTYAGDIARACLAICTAEHEGRARYGSYHFGGDIPVSWCGFAKAIFDCAVALGNIAKAPQLHAITTQEYPTPAKRPAYSVLDNARFFERFGRVHNDWAAALKTVLQESV